MTLCGLMYSGHSFVAFGDVMLSRRFSDPATLPTTLDLAGGDGPITQDGYVPSGLHQKVVLINPYILMLWSGLHTKAERFYNYLYSRLNSCRPYRNEVLLILESFPEFLDPKDIEICIVVNDPDNEPHIFTINTSIYPLEGISGFLTLGSGTTDAFNPLLQEIIRSAITPNNCAVSALRFFGSALIQQSLCGYGLQNLWGGGFEIVVYYKDQFVKIDKILVRGWTVSKNQVFSILPTKYWFFQAYENGVLKVFPIAPTNANLLINPFGARSFGLTSGQERLVGPQRPSHIIDLTFPALYSMSNPDGTMLSIAASDSGPERVILNSSGHYVVRDIKEELGLLWNFLSEYRQKGFVI